MSEAEPTSLETIDGAEDERSLAAGGPVAVCEIRAAEADFEDAISPAADGLPLAEQLRAERILRQPIEYMMSSQFEAPDADELILGPLSSQQADTGEMTNAPSPPTGTPAYLASLYDVPLLRREQEYHLFRKLNYLKYRADRMRRRLDPDRPQIGLLDQIETLLSEALSVRNRIVRANLRLVVSIAKRFVDHANSFDEVISDGNVPLIRAVEIFDFERGTRFSTYATWAIRNSLIRSTRRKRGDRSRFRTGGDAVFVRVADDRPCACLLEGRHAELCKTIERAVSKLDARDRTVVASRFGLNDKDGPQGFREIAAELNISSERVRQLLARALEQLDELIEPDCGGLEN